MKRVNSNLRTQLENSRKKSNHGAIKTKARFLTHPELKAAHAKAIEEHTEKQKEEAVKREQKDRELEEIEARIRQDSVDKIFDLPLASYKRKDELRTIARALGLPEDKKMTISKLAANIRAHLVTNSDELRRNRRFSGLISNKRRHIDAPQSQPCDTPIHPHADAVYNPLLHLLYYTFMAYGFGKPSFKLSTKYIT
ncbi:hypothetical protein BDQ17DRAFT_1337832 [Cyathus striatus]|nr:hypothetical protein BDQ17DRAFT_1337832 [Cyathus striatus]